MHKTFAKVSLNERVYCSSSMTTSLPFSIDRPSTYNKYYGKDHLQNAYETVQSGQLSIRHAAEQYAVPKSILQDHLSGRVLHGATSGPRRNLSDEECEVVSFLKGCSEIGYGRT